MIRNNKVALYARFSSDNQRTESIDAQLRAMEDYCRQHNYTIVETYIDEAKSATSDRRPSFQQMIADSAKGSFNILLVHKLDRFARNRYDSAIYKRELKKNGVHVYSVLENLDNSPESIMLEAILEGMNEYYSQNLAREVMKGMKENAMQCKHTGGKPPLGYDVDPITRRLVINEKEAECVKLIFSMYVEGHGYSEIIATLHAKGYTTKNGNPFRKNSMLSILCNAKYNGTYIYNRSVSKSPDGKRNSHKEKPQDEIIIIEGGCPQIIDDKTFLLAQQRRKENKNKGARNNAKRNYLLSGKVYCAYCGKSMSGSSRYSGNSKTLYVTYRCPSHSTVCSNKEINCSYLQTYVVNLMEREIFNHAAMKRIIKQIEKHQNFGLQEQQQKKRLLERELKKVSQSLTSITDAIASGIMSTTLISKLNELEKQKASIEKELQLTSINAGSLPGSIDPNLIPDEYARLRRNPHSAAYRAFLQMFLDRITVGRYEISITLNLGLNVCSDLNTTFTVRRQEIYEAQKTVK